MNELKLEGWVYFETKATNIKDAIADFKEKCESIGLNVDNLRNNVRFVDKNGETIAFGNDISDFEEFER